MASKWIGYVITANCGSVLGQYTGVLTQVDCSDNSITLTNVERNGVSSTLKKVTLSAIDIKDIQIISCKPNNLIPNASTEPLESPCKLDDPRKRAEPRKKAVTPKRVESRRRFTERDDACFNEPVSDFILENEFDFEKNLALFDKKAVIEELNAISKPDVVRLTDCNRRHNPVKYRNDENVLEQEPVVYRQINIPCIVEKEFVTDSGLIVPSITRELRNHILLSAEKIGFSLERRIEVIGRAGTEMILHLIGGSHRINPQNAHQKPTVVVICGHHVQGTQGISCARQLSNHGVQVYLMTLAASHLDPHFARELTLYEYTDGKITSKIGDLPSNVDIIVGALDSVDDKQDHRTEALWQRAVIQWVANCRAPVLCLDPPPSGTSLSPKWLLSTLLPFAFSEIGVSLYLCDLGIPNQVYKMAGVSYVSVFGSKFVIPLHDKNLTR